MARRWFHRIVAVGLTVVAASTPLVDSGAALAQDPSTPVASASPVAPTPTPSSIPQPVVVLPAMPGDTELAVAAATVVRDTPVKVDGAVDLSAVGAAAAEQVGSMTTSAWSIQALADSFEGDPTRAFTFVRDSIGFDAYAGVLRGAAGTLAARAGNAYDRALLLKTLLDSMALTSRYAFADLDDHTAQEIAARVFQTPPVPLQDGRAAALGPLAVDGVGARARRDYALLRQTLGDRVASMRGLIPADLIPDTRHHAWVQLSWGTGWLDYDPTLPGSAPGQRLAQAVTTASVLPDDVAQAVRIQVIAGSLVGSSVQDSIVLDQPFGAADIADRQVFLYFQPELGGLGGTIVDTLSGVGNWTPVLMVDGEATLGSAFAAGGRGTDVFGDATDAPPLATLRVVITRSVPGRVDEAATHMMLDRVPDLLAGSDTIAATDLAPLHGDESGPLAMGVMEQILVSTGGADPWLQAVRRGISADFLDTLLLDPSTASDHKLGDLLYPLAVADAALVLGSEQLSVPAAADPGRIRAYVGAPRVYLVGIGQDPSNADDFGYSTDLLLDDVRVVAADAAAAPDVARRSIWYGALESALETESALRRASGLSEDPGRLVSTSLAMGLPLTILDTAGAKTAGARPLRDALESGAIAVVAGDPAHARSWWTVDPATGATRAVLDPGYGGTDGGIAWGTIRHRPPVINRGGGGGANTWHLNPDGSMTRTPRPPAGSSPQGPPPSRCGGGSEYTTILGCISIPAAWAIRFGLSLILVAVITDVVIYLVT